MTTKFKKLSEEHDAAIAASLASPVVIAPDPVPANVIIKPRAPHEPLPVGAVTRIEHFNEPDEDSTHPLIVDTGVDDHESNPDTEILPQNLSLIKGLDPISIMRLNDQGIVAYIQIAKLTDSEVAKIENELDLPGCFNRFSWRYQAQQLHLEKNN
ncbi:MAG: hypothetical protein CL470_05870 [Acidimicrobiaceae bacterium]|nr:hypothetical protein [Acidimicrobiaceae bacterium]|tara:strand:- start:145 stop:609 length:465 start_codon:yes stop_codon:yes gene_type:complete